MAATMLGRAGRRIRRSGRHAWRAVSRRPAPAGVAAFAVATVLAVGAVGVGLDQAPAGERGGAPQSMFQGQVGSGPQMMGPHWHHQDLRSHGDNRGH